jgi:hypothetical protein
MKDSTNNAIHPTAVLILPYVPLVSLYVDTRKFMILPT